MVGRGGVGEVWGWVVAGDNTGEKGKNGKIGQGNVCIIILNGDDKPETPHTYRSALKV